MSENLIVADEATAIDHESIPCIESTHSDKIDNGYVEEINSDDCVNSLIDIGERIENCEEFNSVVLMDKNVMNDKESSINVEKQNDHGLIDIENALDQINIDATCSVRDECAISVVQDDIVLTNNTIEVVNDQTDQITCDDMTGKLQFIIYKCLMVKIIIFRFVSN